MKLAGLAVSLSIVHGTLIALYVMAPGWRAPIFAEDRLVETVSALLFLAAFLIGIFRLASTAARPYRLILPAAAAVGLVGFLDEISFGARAFH